VEQEVREVGSVSRGQNVAYVMPHDWASIVQFLAPLVEKIDESTRELQLLVVTSDSEVAAAVAAAAVRLCDGREIAIVAATSAKRATSLLRTRPAQIVSGTPDTLVEMLKVASIKLDTVRAVCLAWADELVTRGASAGLETLMAELPKEGARVVVTAELNPAVEELLERYARRARRVASTTNETDQPTHVDYVTVSAQSRLSALRRVIDETDPRSALVFAREQSAGGEVGGTLRALGYSGEDAAVKVGSVAPAGTELVILYDLPASREELREAAGGAKRTIALIQPRQLPSLRALSAAGTVKPFTLPESSLRARDRDEQARHELREVLTSSQFGRELLALEPLLDEFDGVEIAAAALQLLDRERAARAAALTADAAALKERTPSGGMVRLFVNVGARDNARPGDLVGAITNQGGVSSADIGKVDVRESHSVVEVSLSIADTVISKVTGAEIRGRRVILRRDEGAPDRGGREGRPSSRDAGRPPRDAKRGPPRSREGGSSSRGERPERGERSDRPPRRPRGE
jgi:ATP-dependent RNA helicase DeaD